MIYQHCLGIADEGDVVHGLELGDGTVEDKELEGLRVTYPQEVSLRIVIQVSHLLNTRSDGAELLLPELVAACVVGPEIGAGLGTHVKHVVFVVGDSLESGVAEVCSFRHLKDLCDGVVIGSRGLAYPVGLAAEVQVERYRIYGYALKVCLAGLRGSHLYGDTHVEPYLIEGSAVANAPHEVFVLAEVQTGKLCHL